jgi:hypothetical protein
VKTNKLILAVLLAGLTVPAFAEESAPEQRNPAGAVASPGDFRAGFLNGVFSTQLGVTPLKNAPYSGESVTETRQTLGDGNQIARRRSFTAYRDSAGRTRLEQRNDKGDVETITIHDPVAGANWFLSPQTHNAIRTPINRTAVRTLTREQIEQMRKDGHEEILVKRVERPDGEARQRIQEQIRIRAEAGAGAGSPHRVDRVQIGSALAAAFGDAKWAAQATTKDLGTRDFNGVKAEGKLRSYEIPAGEIGNRNPIVVSDETWYAPDLQVTVYTRHSDPRSGDTVFHLENLKREEPAASLFAVPSDYTIKDPQAK